MLCFLYGEIFSFSKLSRGIFAVENCKNRSPEKGEVAEALVHGI